MCFRPMASKLAASFYCAAAGVASCVLRERNFRIHMAAVCYTAALGVWMRLDRVSWALLFLTQALVLAMELVNTAVEAAVDLCCPKKHPLAKRAKDAAAGAVLVSAAFSVAVGACLFWNERVWGLAISVLTSPRAFLTLAASVILSLWFIFGFGSLFGNKNGQIDGHPADTRSPGGENKNQ